MRLEVVGAGSDVVGVTGAVGLRTELAMAVGLLGTVATVSGLTTGFTAVSAGGTGYGMNLVVSSEKYGMNSPF